MNIRRLAAAGVLSFTGILTLAGCLASAQSLQSEDTASSNSGNPPTATPTGDTVPESAGTAITMTVDGRVVTATLHDNPAAQALVRQLPLTLTFDDFHAVEKTARLPFALSMQGMPEGDDPEVGDIGFWAPGGDLVLYYGDVGYWNGIARLGTFDDVDAIAGQTGPFRVTIAIP